MSRWPGHTDCGCAIALRVQSTLACKALAELPPKVRRRLLREADEHAARLRAACDRGDHGPQAKPEPAPDLRLSLLRDQVMQGRIVAADVLSLIDTATALGERVRQYERAAHAEPHAGAELPLALPTRDELAALLLREFTSAHSETFENTRETRREGFRKKADAVLALLRGRLHGGERETAEREMWWSSEEHRQRTRAEAAERALREPCYCCRESFDADGVCMAGCRCSKRSSGEGEATT